ncbi:MAG: signal peptidase II [Piscinibacter sp.]|nr:signal peptidase II [Piscinibacter sp.]
MGGGHEPALWRSCCRHHLVQSGPCPQSGSRVLLSGRRGRLAAACTQCGWRRRQRDAGSAPLARRSQPTRDAVAYVGMIGGALGNVVDRMRIGAVVDYLDLHWRDMHWPAFNLADIFVVGSAALLILVSFLPGGAGRRAGQGHST